MSSNLRRPRTRSPSPSRRQEEKARRDYSRDRGERTRDRERSRSKERAYKESTSRRSASPPRKRRDSRSRSRTPKRRRSRSREDRDKRRRRSRSASSVSSEDSEDEERRKKRKKEKKERKREKREKKKRHAANSGAEWGKYGIISESDIFNKSQEFYAWLVEERKINPETVTKDTNKKEFSRFVEDYNTATLPSDKYYNIDAYEKRMNAMRQGEYLPPADDGYDANADIKAHRNTHKRKEVEHESYLSREQLMELRKVQHERIEVGKRKLMGMDVKATLGVRMEDGPG